MIQSIHIENQCIGALERPFIIAEMSGNHNKSLDRAMEIVRAAALAGASAIKLQTYTADTMTLPEIFKIEDENSLWQGRELYELYQEAATPWEWHKPIFEYARSLGLVAFSSPFDASSVDFLEELGVGAFKIASFENTDLPLLTKIAATRKPVILSTGASTLSELDEAVSTLRTHGCTELILLKCTSTYPASPEQSNLKTIPHLQQLYQCQVGLSDHTMGIGVPIAAIALGATVIEKHFTLNRADGGVDSAFSLEPHELKSLVQESERAFLAMGEIRYGVQVAEQKSVAFKRSVYVVKDIKAGDFFSDENIRVIRPANGLAPRYYQTLLGKRAAIDIKRGTPMTWGLI